jgi:hypothetical protein
MNTAVFSTERVAAEPQQSFTRTVTLDRTGVRHNYLAIGLLVMFYQALGVVWYLPATFGDIWFAAQSRTEIANINQALLYAFGGAFALNLVISFCVQKFGITTLAQAARFAVLFTVAIGLQMIVVRFKFLSMPDTVIAIDFGYTLVEILVSSLVLAVWRKK